MKCMTLPRVNKRNLCAICGYSDYCGFTSDGELAICMRVQSDKPTRNGGWIHILNPKTGRSGGKIIVKPTAPITTIAPVILRTSEEIDEVYRKFLDNLVLAKSHETDLQKRGLGMVSINLHGYKSMPSPVFADAICKLLSQICDLRGIPGFYTKNKEWHFIDYRCATGTLIPIRNSKHQICAMTLRRDDDRSPKYLIISTPWQENGTPSGVPPHFATLGKIYRRDAIESLIVTEGVLKANVACELADAPVVGLISVTTFNETFSVILKEAFPQLQTVKIAFDMDAATNQAVAAQRRRLGMTLADAGIKSTILTWDRAYKGFDDYLLSLKNKRKLAA